MHPFIKLLGFKSPCNPNFRAWIRSPAGTEGIILKTLKEMCLVACYRGDCVFACLVHVGLFLYISLYFFISVCFSLFVSVSVCFYVLFILLFSVSRRLFSLRSFVVYVIMFFVFLFMYLYLICVSFFIIFCCLRFSRCFAGGLNTRPENTHQHTVLQDQQSLLLIHT